MRYITLIATFSVLLIFYSCSNKIKESASTIVFPEPPDTARFQFLKAIQNSHSISKPRGKLGTIIYGKEKTNDFSKPYGICLKNGKMYITDSGIKGVHIINLNKNTFETFVPTGKEEVKLPLNCAVDNNENLYIADGVLNKILIFDKNREFKGTIGGSDNFNPMDVVIFDNKLWVTNKPAHQVFVYDISKNNELISTFPEAELGNPDWLYSPINLTVDSNHVYVSDIGDCNVKMFSKEGKYIKTFGGYGKELGRFTRPKGVAVDRDSNVFVVDAAFENVQVFNSKKQLLMFFGGPYKGPGNMYLPAKVIIDYDHMKYFEKYLDKKFNMKYLVLVTNQYGPDKITIYAAIKPALNIEEETDDNGKKKKKKWWKSKGKSLL